jgi:hypothetical protein
VGVATGPKSEGGSDLVVVDIDRNHKNKPGVDGMVAWEALRDVHSDPLETITAITSNNGRHLFFAYPDGYIIKSRNDVLGEGVDVKATGGYVIFAPSDGYSWELSPQEYPIMSLPEWLLNRIGSLTGEAAKVHASSISSAQNALKNLKPSRADNYDEWLHVGMALHELGEDGLILWDSWSQRSEKYKPGDCAQKWQSFSANGNNITLGSLYYWAREDTKSLKAEIVSEGKKSGTPAEYATALTALGYSFSMNEMNDMVYSNGLKMTDILTSVIEYEMRNRGYKSEKDTQVAINKLAFDNRFHPIKNYLEGLTLEGHFDGVSMQPVDHIGRLCSYFEDRDGIFPLLIRWVRAVLFGGWEVRYHRSMFNRTSTQMTRIFLYSCVPNSFGKLTNWAQPSNLEFRQKSGRLCP